MNTILFVDDEENVLRGLRRALRRHRDQYEMHFAASADEAKAVLAEHSVDIIVSDMHMPHMTGAELLRFVRDEYPMTLRVVLSGHAAQEAIMSSIGPAHQFLGKPCESDKVVETLDRLSKLRDRLNDPRAFTLVGSLDGLPTPSPVIAETMALLDKPESTSAEIAEVVEKDASLTAQVLRLVSSPYFGLSREIQDLQHAVTILGGTNLRMAILSAGILEGFPDDAWTRACAAEGRMFSEVARELATGRKLPRSQRSRVAMAAMLGHIGRLVLAVRDPGYRALCARAPDHLSLIQSEKETYGADHAAIGSFLLGIWGLDWDIVEAVGNHHLEPNDELPVVTRITCEAMASARLAA